MSGGQSTTIVLRDLSSWNGDPSPYLTVTTPLRIDNSSNLLPNVCSGFTEANRTALSVFPLLYPTSKVALDALTHLSCTQTGW